MKGCVLRIRELITWRNYPFFLVGLGGALYHFATQALLGLAVIGMLDRHMLGAM